MIRNLSLHATANGGHAGRHTTVGTAPIDARGEKELCEKRTEGEGMAQQARLLPQ